MNVADEGRFFHAGRHLKACLLDLVSDDMLRRDEAATVLMNTQSDMPEEMAADPGSDYDDYPREFGAAMCEVVASAGFASKAFLRAGSDALG